jgi:hypothetical protein
MSQRDKNRADFPMAAMLLDEFRKHFGEGVKLVYASENGKVIGKLDAGESGRFLTADQYLALGKTAKPIEKAQVSRARK